MSGCGPARASERRAGARRGMFALYVDMSVIQYRFRCPTAVKQAGNGQESALQAAEMAQYDGVGGPFRPSAEAGGAGPVRSRLGDRWSAAKETLRGQPDYSPGTTMLGGKFSICIHVRLLRPRCGHVTGTTSCRHARA